MIQSSAPSPGPLLLAKLAPPELPAGFVARPRLRRLLSEGAQGPVTLVAAPAGFGKTTLLSDWARAAPPVVGGRPAARAWLALEPEDDEPVRFLRYLVAALRAVAPEVGADALALLDGRPAPVRVVVTALLNDVAARRGAPVVLVVDDLHALGHDELKDGIGFLAEHVPSSLRLVMAARGEPALPVARLRARGMLAEVRGDALRFTPPEAEALLTAIGGIMSPDAVARIEARTAGWAIGLRLAAMAARGRAAANRSAAGEGGVEGDGGRTAAGAFDPAAALGAADGMIRDAVGGTASASDAVVAATTDARVAEYLMEEVFGQLPLEIRGFLARTAVLERLSAPLCAAVAATPGAAQALDDIVRRHLFVTAEDGGRGWFRYHQLFRAFLLERLEADYPGEAAALHARAAAWLGASGFPAEAIHHHLEAGDVDGAARAAAGVALDHLRRGEIGTLWRWLERLPEVAIREHPSLCLAQVWLLMNTNRVDAVVPYLERLNAAFAATPASGDEGLEAEVEVLRAVTLAVQGRPDEALVLAERGGDARPDDPFLRSLARFAMAVARKKQRDLDGAERLFLAARSAAVEAGNPYLAFTAVGNVADVRFEAGRLDEALASAREALALAEPVLGVVPPHVGWTRGSLARIHYQRGALDEARAMAEVAAGLCEAWGNPVYRARTAMLRASIAQAGGQTEAARSILDYAERVARHAPDPEVARQVTRQRIALAVAQGDLPAARHWAAVLLEEPGAHGFADDVALARIALAGGDAAAAAERLRGAWAAIEAEGSVAERVEALLVASAADRRLGRHAAAEAGALRAVALAAPGRMVRAIADEGVAARELLGALPVPPDQAAFVVAVLAALGATAGTPPLPTPLTEREREVLRLLAEGLTNRQVAERLVIAEATAKRHVSNVFVKLDVASRTRALARARELGLV